jgi:geranylgeranylglycerol-phosphate geranylgeranyltransferase
VSLILDTLRLIRVVNCLLAMVGVWIGAYLTWLSPVYYGPTVAALAAFLVCAAGNTVNDLADIETDRINRPHRVMVRGAISRKYARNLAVVLNLVAVGMAFAVSYWLVAIACATIAMLLAYNLRLKRIPVLGNLVVALLAGMTFLTGGVAVDPSLTFRLPGPLIAAAYAFLFHLVREIIKDVQDMEGDRATGMSSLPLRWGVSKSLLLALALFLILVILTYVPIFEGWFGRSYEIITVYVVDLPLLALLIFVWGNPTPRMLASGSTALKIGMTLGLIALLLA